MIINKLYLSSVLVGWLLCLVLVVGGWCWLVGNSLLNMKYIKYYSLKVSIILHRLYKISAALSFMRECKLFN